MDDKKDNTSIVEKVTEKELIGGRIYNRAPLNEKAKKIAQIFQVIAQKYKLTNKPLDYIYEPFEAINIKNNTNTIIRPMLGVKTNRSPNEVDWIVDYTDKKDDALAYCIKPMIFKNSGISEYWIIDIQDETIVIYDFKKNGYQQEIIRSPRRIKVGIYNSLILNYSDIF